MKKCRKHVQDLTSTIGVCATCLRERLEVILVAQTQAQAQTHDEDEDQLAAEALSSNNQSEKNSDEENNPPPINANDLVPLQVSRQKSDFAGRKDDDNDNDTVVYRTPQVGPPFSVTASSEFDGKTPKRKFGKFWNPTSLFRTRSNKTENSHRGSATMSRSWLSMIFRESRKNNNGGGASNFRQSDREPEMLGGENDENDRSSSTGSRISCETSPKRRNQSAPVRRSRSVQPEKSGFKWAYCLSPLVRVEPNSNQNLVHNHKGAVQETGSSVGGGAQQITFTSTASFCSSRSRKLANFGRVAHNR
ncbi:hypothetical protein PIB30_001208 [Stylosanthes scabra]|uniref:Uncharacterized protein n=1 Tax=Stylosanthes scabra TaxID=79078 RepID=A0ABU6W274_9FABA|nr:hypothetical protein [Stylosanthes scabra]